MRSSWPTSSNLIERVFRVEAILTVSQVTQCPITLGNADLIN